MYFRRFRITVWLLVLALLGALLYLTQVGLPDFAKQPLLDNLRARGVELQFSRLRLSWQHGIVAENVRFGRADESLSPELRVALVQMRLNHRALSRLQIQIDSLLLMTVNPGFGGQSFIYETLPKVQQAFAWRSERRLAYRIGVDGGVDFKTAAECAHVGADTFISGTTLFSRPNLGGAVKKMRKIVEAARLKGFRSQSAKSASRLPVLNPQLR